MYDAQVDSLLVDARITNGKKNGSMFDESYKGNRMLSGEAAYELMADPRK
jgi:hypothetical protein